MRIVIEVGTHSPWICWLLERYGHEVSVADARKLRLIYCGKHKTDRLEAENLTRLARLDPQLVCPLKHHGEQSQTHLALLRSCEALIGARTRPINHVQGAAKSFGAHLTKCSSPRASTRNLPSTCRRRCCRPWNSCSRPSPR